MRNESIMTVVNDHLNCLNMTNDTKPKLRQQKIMVTVQWFAIDIIYYSFLEYNQSITAELYSQKLHELHMQLSKPALVNRLGPILLHNNVWSYIASLTLQMLFSEQTNTYFILFCLFIKQDLVYISKTKQRNKNKLIDINYKC